MTVSITPSTATLSKLYRERLDCVLAEADPAVVPSYNHRFSRQWFAERIGCSPKTLTQSPALRTRIEKWEKQYRRKAVHRQGVEPASDASIVVFKRKLNTGAILMVDVAVGLITKQTYTIPTLCWNGGLDEWVADYARHLVVWEKQEASSVEQAVKALRIFRRLQHKRNVRDKAVNDELLLAWQIAMTSAGIGVARRNYCISVVHDFFKWAEEQGHLLYHVQVRSRHEYSNLPEDYTFPLGSNEVEVKLPHGHSYLKWVSRLLEPGETSTFGSRHTPTATEVESLLTKAEASGRNSARNLLMLLVALETGARVSEIVQLKVGDFPNLDELAPFIGSNARSHLQVKVVRKNQGVGTLRFNKELVLSIVAFIYTDPQRQKIVSERRIGRNSNDDAVFLSEEGGPLSEDSVTRIGGGVFAEAGVENANIHRLRARFITEVIELQLDMLAEEGVTVNRSEAWENQVLMMAVELMGHSHPMSLRPYLNSVLNRRLTKDGRVLVRSPEDRERSLERLRSTLTERVVQHSKLSEADRMIASGDRAAAAVLLQQVIDALRLEPVGQL
ncbi:site-specific recombinase XerD [Rhizobium leguminosarum bv. trifolii WSM2297]|uniref:Site-specific recombinase XerD n=1 Tax=Rhizobium leguminosarum bv. trifolii WSM2297 TaxID=754762 RepID=J0CL60_RHILT|nr:site-specific integrase [Rhizobium leguminosarum]EJC80250.1 site-specific recombinase XerD [Rhizobium leguminosarum bv. trifolii WSM2297]